MIDKFTQFLKDENKSENTIEGYIIDISNFLKWNNKNNQFTHNDISSYIKYLSDNNRSAKTINRKLSSLYKYNLFLVNQKVIDSIVITKNDFIKIQVSYASPTSIGENDIDKLLTNISNSNNKNAIRDYTIIYLIKYTGLRISEALDIKLKDINFKKGEIIIKSGKGNKQRIIYPNTKVIDIIKKYIIIRNTKKNKDSEYLFISQKGCKLVRNTMNRIFNDYSNLTPHELRHFFCTHALESGMNIHEVANQAGHSSIQTTLLYTNPRKEELKHKMELL